MSVSGLGEFIGLQEALRGEYSLDREIGRGGMGIVYLARDVVLDRPVAIKILPPALAASAEVRARFIREARTAAQLSHPNVVPIHRADERAGFAFFVMSYVDGETLGARIRRGGPLAPPEAARILREVAWALAYSHGRGIVHRDVKPENILLERDTGRALVTDFGIAQIGTESSNLTGAGHVLGSAHFMSPEQAAGERLDGRSDTYSLGVVGFFALSGRLPFDGDTIQSIMAKHITQDAPPLEVADARPELIAAIRRALAKNPADRFPSAEEFAGTLALAESPALPIPAPLRAWLRTTNVTVVMLAGLSAIFVAWLYWFGTNPEELLPWILLPIAILLINTLRETRAALDAGFTLDDLRRSLRQDGERHREEQRYLEQSEQEVELRESEGADRAPDPGPRATASRGVSDRPRWVFTVLTWVGVIMLIAVRLIWGERVVDLILIPANVVWVLVLAALLAFAGTRLEERIRLWFWTSWPGAAIAAFARMGISPRNAPGSGRPTAEVIGLAIDDLLTALPKDLRRRFEPARDITRRLEDEAAALRKRRDESARLALVVGALEAIRLDLLRLHSGRGDTASLEAALKAAEELGRDVRRAVEANAEVEAWLRSPGSRA